MARRTLMSSQLEKADAVYAFVRSYFAEHGHSPTILEIGVACKLSRTTVTACIRWLQLQGKLRRRIGTARSIVLLDMDDTHEAKDT